MTDPAHLDELERRGDSLLDEERYERDRRLRDRHCEYDPGESAWLVTRGADHIRVSVSGLNALSADAARQLANAILDEVAELEPIGWWRDMEKRES